MRGVAPPSYSELASKLQIDSPKAVGNAWVTVKRMIQRHFLTAVQQYLPSGTTQESLADVENEAREMLFGLAAKGGLRIKIEEGSSKAETSCESASFELAGLPVDDLFKTNADLKEAWNGTLSTKVSILFSEPIQSDGDLLFRDWIQSTSPSLKSLDRVRQIAKQYGKRKNEELSDINCFPLETWALIYLLVLAIAKLRLGENLSKTRTEELKTRMLQFCNAEWIDEYSCDILTQFVNLDAS